MPFGSAQMVRGARAHRLTTTAALMVAVGSVTSASFFISMAWGAASAPVIEGLHVATTLQVAGLAVLFPTSAALTVASKARAQGRCET